MCQPGRPRPMRVSQKCSPGFGRFPQREIARVFLFVAIDVHAHAGLNAGDIDLGELAVVGKFRDAIIDGAFALVGERFFAAAARSAAPCRRCGRWRGPSVRASRGSSVLQSSKKACDEFLGVIANADARGGGVGDDAVVHVGQDSSPGSSCSRATSGSGAEYPGRRRCGNFRCARSRRPWGRKCTCALRPLFAARKARFFRPECCAAESRPCAPRMLC